MTATIIKLRDLIQDNYQFFPDTQEYLTSKIFNLQYANIDFISLVVQKNGVVWSITPVAGTGVAWARTGTVITITKNAHGFITGDSMTVITTSEVLALPLGTYLVTKLTANTFTVVGLNAGVTSGTCTYTVIANYSYLNGKVTITGNLTAGNKLEFDYNAYEKYSDNELRSYIRSALTYLATEKYKTFTAKSDNIIFPTLSEAEENLIALIASVIISGAIRSYRTPEFTINFNEDEPKDKKIKRIIAQFQKTYGTTEYIDLGNKSVPDDNN